MAAKFLSIVVLNVGQKVWLILAGSRKTYEATDLFASVALTLGIGRKWLFVTTVEIRFVKRAMMIFQFVMSVLCSRRRASPLFLRNLLGYRLMRFLRRFGQGTQCLDKPDGHEVHKVIGSIRSALRRSALSASVVAHVPARSPRRS